MKCKNCQEKEGAKYSKYSTGEFCSVNCARGFSTKSKRKEINAKVSAKLKGIRPVQCYSNLFSPEVRQKRRDTLNKKSAEKVQNTSIELLTPILQKRKLLIEQNYKCAICDCDPVHNGKELKFQRDHINGNHNDNRRENLRAICPNCHSQTETYCTKNIVFQKKIKLS